MLDLLYLTFLILLLGYFLISERKEIPFVILVHALGQYFVTQFFWLNQMTEKMTGLLLLFMILTSGILVWARSLNYGKEFQMIRMFFRVSGWAILLMAVIVAWVKGNYVLVQPYSQIGVPSHFGGWELHAFIKICGNGLAFIMTLHLVFGWGERWTARASLADFLPFFLFCIWMLLLKIYLHPPTGMIASSSSFGIPFTSTYF